jgi:hypothetical protein
MPLVNPIISKVVPIKIGGAANAGAGRLASAFDHIHPLIETAGPTNLTPGAILDGEGFRRVGSSIVGRLLRANSNTGGNISTSLATPSDVSPSLTFPLQAGLAYVALWLLNYETANATTGIMLSVNFTGTATSNRRMGALIATGATTMFSNTAATLDTLLGNPTVGPGSNNRAALIWCRVGTSTAGDLALRFASGVAGQAATIGSESFGLVFQQ